MIFIAIFLLLLLLSLTNLVLGNKNMPKIFIYAFAFILIFLATVRFESGADFGSYSEIFDMTSSELRLTLIEPLFSLWNFLSSKICNNFNFFLLTVAIFAISIKIVFFYKYSPYVYLSLFIYYCGNYLVQDIGQIRQGLAIAFTFAALHFFLKERKKYFYFFVFIATMLHFSAIIFILVPLASKIKFKISFRVISWIIAYLGAFAFRSYSNLLLGLDGLFANSFLALKLSYVTDDDYNQMANFGLGMGFRMLLLIYASNVVEKYKSSLSATKYRHYQIIINLYYFGGLIYFLFSFVEIYAGRFSLYYLILETILLPIVLNLSRDRIMKTCILIIYLAFAFSMVKYTVFDSKVNFLTPFKTILE